jgi:membrane protease YdiL (CAAX protease family)
VHFFTILFLGLQIFILPILSFQTREVIENDEPLPSKRAVYIQSIGMLMLIGGIAGLVFWKENLPIQWMSAMNGKVILAAVSLYIGSLAVNIIHYKWQEKKNDLEDKLILPTSSGEYAWWVLLCFTAAWAEEFAYRGVLSLELVKLGMLPILAAILSAICFSFSHYTQGWIAVPITFVFALGFQWLFQLSGGLLIPMLVHFFYNLSVEWIRRWLVRQRD